MKRGRHPAMSTQSHTTSSYQISFKKDITAQHLSIFVTSAHLPIELSNKPVQLARTGEVLTVHVKKHSHDVVSYYTLDTTAVMYTDVDANRALLVGERDDDAGRCLGAVSSNIQTG